MNRKQNSLMRFSRTERQAQLSEQEVVIERKKREIQAKLEARKKKEIEDALKKLESSKETVPSQPDVSKNTERSFGKKVNWGSEISNEPKKESLTNAFSNDGSFLDHFKKLSQKGFSKPTVANISKTKPIKNDGLERSQESKSSCDNSKSYDEKQSKSSIYSSILPSGVTQHQHVFSENHLGTSAQEDNSVFSTQLNYPKSNYLNSVSTPLNEDSKLNSSKGNPATDELKHFINSSQNIISQFSNHSQKISSNILPKIRSESISMTLKVNSVKKLEGIPNPFESDLISDSSIDNQNNSKKRKDNPQETFLQNSSCATKLRNVFDDEESKVSSAFIHDNERKDHSSSLFTEKCRHWAELVARCGDAFEDSLVSRHENEPDLRFLLNKSSKEYLQYRKLVLKYRSAMHPKKESLEKAEKFPHVHKKEIPIETDSNNLVFSDTTTGICSNDSKRSIIEPELQDNKSHFNEDVSCNNASNSSEDCYKLLQKHSPSQEVSCYGSEQRRKRKRKSRWGEAEPSTSAACNATNIQSFGVLPAPKSTLLSQLTRSDPGLIQYAKQTFGSTTLSEEDWKKAEDHYKINLLYQDMVKKRAEVEKLEKQGKFKYEYDSDEDTEGGTWEHKLRQQEMQATQLWAEELTRQAAGKHHIGDFLPPEELERFMEKYNAVKEGREPDLSDYKEYKLKEDNVGYRLLQKMGWNEGQGLGQDGSGITNPVNKAITRHENQGLGVERPDGLEAGDDEYDAYRKRMMLAYRFRPNPLNNPRRPYY